MSISTEHRHVLDRQCTCWACLDAMDISPTGMILCSQCGNKRCPHADDHDYVCHSSNEPGQVAELIEGAPHQEDSVLGESVHVSVALQVDFDVDRDRLIEPLRRLDDEQVSQQMAPGLALQIEQQVSEPGVRHLRAQVLYATEHLRSLSIRPDASQEAEVEQALREAADGDLSVAPSALEILADEVYRLRAALAAPRLSSEHDAPAGLERFEVRVAVDWDTHSFGSPEPEDLWVDARNILSRELDHQMSPEPLHPQSVGQVVRPSVQHPIDVQALRGLVDELRGYDPGSSEWRAADLIQQALGDQGEFKNPAKGSR